MREDMREFIRLLVTEDVRKLTENDITKEVIGSIVDEIMAGERFPGG